MVSALTLALLIGVFGGLFVVQVVTRLRLVRRAPGALPTDKAAARTARFVREVVFQSKVIAGKPLVGLAHAVVFWGFVAFAGYTAGEFLAGLRIVDITHTVAFEWYARALVPFAAGVLVGIVGLVVRRVAVRPEALGPLSWESVLIGVFIATLMITFLRGVFHLDEGLAASVNWWLHAVVLLVFLALIPNSKHFHLVLSPVTVFLKSPTLGDVRNLDFEKEEVGLETVGHLEKKQVLDAFTCVECGRCQMNCPAYATGKRLNPKTLILRNEVALLAGRLDAKLADQYDAGVLWQCTTCGACEQQCPVGVEHLPLVIGARRGLASNGEAPDALGAMYNHVERRGNIWGLTSDVRQKFVASAGLETFDPSRHEYLMWLGCAGSYDGDFQKSLRALFSILRAHGVAFGVLAKERCTGDPAKRTGQRVPVPGTGDGEHRRLRGVGRQEDPDRVPALPEDARRGLSAVRVRCRGAALGRVRVGARAANCALPARRRWRSMTRATCRGTPATWTNHAPCLRGSVPSSWSRSDRAATRSAAAPAAGCCSRSTKRGPGSASGDSSSYRRPGPVPIVTACPFCAIMLKGAQASANATTEVVDLMTFVDGRMRPPSVGAPIAAAQGPSEQAGP